MLGKKRGDVFGDYLAQTKQKYETGGYVKIYQDAVDKIDAPEPGAPPAANTAKK